MKLFSKSVEKKLLYRAYGLIIESAIELPELIPATGTPNVTIRFGTVAKRPEELFAGGNGFWSEGGQYCHYRDGVGAFLVTGGVSIVVDTRETGSEVEGVESLLRSVILGPVLGLALIQRGHFLLHASAVEFGGVAVAFLGRHGAQQSTLAAPLHALGRPLVTDDILALNDTAGDVHVLPSFPQLKAWDDDAAALGSKGHPRAYREYDEWAWRPADGVVAKPIPLRRIYALEIGAALEIEELSPHEGSQHVMSNWFGARFGAELFDDQDEAVHYRQCIDLAESVSTRRLRRPDVEGGFATLASQIEDLIRVDLALEI